MDLVETTSYGQVHVPTGKKGCLLAQVLMTSYEPQPYLGAPFSFKSKQNLTRLEHDYSSHILNLHAEGKKWGVGGGEAGCHEVAC